MSLARNPNAPYQMTGRQAQPFEAMQVRSHVYVPSAEANADFDGRTSFVAPAGVRHRESPTVSVGALLVICLIAVVILMLKLLPLVQQTRAAQKEQYNTWYAIREIRAENAGLEASIAAAQEESTLCYQAVQRIGMVRSQGKAAEEIIAPETRPNTGIALEGGSTRASLND